MATAASTRMAVPDTRRYGQGERVGVMRRVPRARHSPEPGAADRWAVLGEMELLAALATRRAGLRADEATERLAHHGANLLPRPQRLAWYARFALHFAHFFALLLWVAACLAWFAGMPELAVAIAGVVLVNGAFSYWQEHEAEQAVAALEALLPLLTNVRRDGREQRVPASHVVPGDVLLLAEGDVVPADACLLRADRLLVDLSLLTGESRPVPRAVVGRPTGGPHAPTTRPNLVFGGTSIASGRGEAVVFATGAATEFGRVAELTHAQRERPSPLERELRRVMRVVTVLAGVMGAGFFAIGVGLGGLDPLAAFVFGVGILVANVPEGLLPTLTLSLALGARRMARRRAIVKRLSALEALGATTVILTDKTGTLTENEMTVREAWTGGALHGLTGTGYGATGSVEALGAGATPEAARRDVEALLRSAALCTDARFEVDADGRKRGIGDPTELALLVAAGKAGLGSAELARWSRLGELPFDSSRRRMTTLHADAGGVVACVKGAPADVLARCTRVRWLGAIQPLEAQLRAAAEQRQDQFARRGLRVLAVAMRDLGPPARDLGTLEPDDVERELVLLGLVGMEDPPRASVPDAVRACRDAGIVVRMITGDSGLTAAAIGREIGLFDGEPRVITGEELDRLGPDALRALLRERNLAFARVTPEHKLRLVQAHQELGEVVAVTGDGVNDAPALKRAEVGVAMGETGTDVARAAADVVLADDDFGTIVAAIEEGRASYDNVRKFVTYIFASNVPEIVPFVAFVLFRIPLPLSVMQILAVDLGTDLVPALALGAEPAEPDVMRRPPRGRSEHLLDAPTLLRAYAWLGAIQAVLSLGAFFAVYWLAGWRPGEVLAPTGAIYAQATTATFAGIVACQVGNLFACRGARMSALVPRGRNRLLGYGIAVELGLLFALVYVPPLARVFGFAPLSPTVWLLLAPFPVVLVALDELRKLLRPRSPLTTAPARGTRADPPGGARDPTCRAARRSGRRV